MLRVIAPSHGAVPVGDLFLFRNLLSCLMPAFAQDILHQGADGLGYIISGFGAGAVSGAALVSKLPERHFR